MDSTIPIQNKAFIPSMGQTFQPGMGQPIPQMGQQPLIGMQRPQNQMLPFPIYPPLEASLKVSEFKRAVFVSGFEPSLTAAMLQEHFKIKPIDGLKLPMSKFNENKGFAFVYYKSADDAAYVKEKLDHTVILRKEIRVTKAVIANNLSKIMLKLKVNNLSEQQVKDVKARFFNEKSLENEISKILQTNFADLIEVNKVIIPKSKQSPNTPLNYARCFFYISDARKAKSQLRISLPSNIPNVQEYDNKEPYKFVLEKIVEKLNENAEFSRHAEAQVYVYSDTKKSSVVHLKNISVKPEENLSTVQSELKELISNQNKQWNIKDVYVGRFNNKFGWATITLETHEEAKQIYDFFKNNETKFRDVAIYGNLTNTVDERTVVISPVKEEVTEALMEQFLNRIAESSARVDGTNEAKGRKYDYVSFNILGRTDIVDIGNGGFIPVYKKEDLKEWHRIHHTLPKRVVIHFKNDILEKDIQALNSDVKLASQNAEIFDLTTIVTKHALKGNHPKGHIDRHTGLYIKHHNLPKERRDKEAPQRQRMNRTENRRPGPEGANYNVRPTRPQNAPRGVGSGQRNMVPFVRPGQPQMINRPIGQMGTIPNMGGNFRNNNIPVPMNAQIPIGQPRMGVPPMGMGNVPSMGMGNIPPMGMSNVPPMGGLPPMGMGGMGVPPMGTQPPKMGINNGIIPPKQ